MASNYGSTNVTPSSEKILNIVTRISSNLQNIRQITQTLTELCNLLGGSRDSSSKRDEIQKQEKRANELLSKTKSLFETSAMVKNIDESSRLSLSKAKNEYERAIQKYSEIQKKIMDKLTRLAEEMRQSHANRSVDFSGSQDKLQMQEELEHDEIDEELIKEEDIQRRMAELNKDLINVQQMFTEVNNLVVEDAERIDNLEHNVEEAATEVDMGNQKLGQAVVYKKSAFKKKIIIAIIIIVILAIIGLIIGLEVKKK